MHRDDNDPCLRSPGKGRIEFNPRAPYPLRLNRHARTLKGFHVQYQLRDDTGVKFKLSAKDARGNEATITDEVPEVTVSDPAILNARFEGMTLIVEPVGPLGSAQVSVTLDTAEGQTINGLLDVTVIGGTAVSFNFEPTETFPSTGVAAPDA